MKRTILFLLLLISACNQAAKPNEITAIPKLELSDSSLLLSAVLGERASERFELLNTGDTELNYSLSVTQSWLQFSSLSAKLELAAVESIRVSAICETVGSFEDIIKINSEAEEQTLKVTLECLEANPNTNPEPQPEPEPLLPASLTITISGLPEGLNASVQLTADNFSRSFSDSESLTNLNAGEYKITAETVSQADELYSASVNPAQLELLAGESKTVTVSYSLQVPETGSLNLLIDGLPEAANANLILTKEGSETFLSQSQVLSNLATGRYDLEINEVNFEGASFQTNANIIPVEILAGQTTQVNVSYNCAQLVVADAALHSALQETLNQTNYSCKDLEGLEELSIQRKNIDSLQGLRYAKNLRGLSAYDNPLTNLNELRYLKKLEFLNLFNIDAQDISALSALSQLNYLALSNSKVQDLSALSSLNKLLFLYLSNTRVEDISPLSQLTSLVELDLSATFISDIGGLANLSNLVYLNLNSTSIADISVLTNLLNLDELSLAETKIPDISALQALNQLTFLDISHNELSDLSYLKQASQLRRLDARDNNISDLSILVAMPELEELYLSKNTIRDISALSQTTELEHLDLNENSVSDLEPLLALNQLNSVSLELNCLEVMAVPTRGYIEQLNAKLQSLNVQRNPHVDCDTRNVQKAIVQTFDADAEGWTVAFSRVEHVQRAGQSYLYAETERALSWSAPDIYLGDARDFIGKRMSFDLAVTQPDLDRIVTVIIGGAGDLMIAPLEPATLAWRTFSLGLNRDSFYAPGPFDTPINQADFIKIMTDIDYISISPNSPPFQPSSTSLDNVSFGIN